MFCIKVAIKPKGKPRRWVTKGYCCDECHERGCKISFEFGEYK